MNRTDVAQAVVGGLDLGVPVRSMGREISHGVSLCVMNMETFSSTHREIVECVYTR
jgi:hypothetical protein